MTSTTGKQFGIQAAPFSEAIHIGELTKDRTRFKGEFQDASHEAIAAVGEFVKKHYGGGAIFTFDDLVVTIKVGSEESTETENPQSLPTIGEPGVGKTFLPDAEQEAEAESPIRFAEAENDAPLLGDFGPAAKAWFAKSLGENNEELATALEQAKASDSEWAPTADQILKQDSYWESLLTRAQAVLGDRPDKLDLLNALLRSAQNGNFRHLLPTETPPNEFTPRVRDDS